MGREPIAGRVAETTPGTQAVKGLIPKREGQAYRPDRLKGIKGRARARLLTRVRRILRKAALAGGARTGQRPVCPGLIPQRDTRKGPRRLLDAWPRARVREPRTVPEEVLITAPVPRVGDRSREGRVAVIGPPNALRNGVR